jgi:hypothetical protein
VFIFNTASLFDIMSSFSNQYQHRPSCLFAILDVLTTRQGKYRSFYQTKGMVKSMREDEVEALNQREQFGNNPIKIDTYVSILKKILHKVDQMPTEGPMPTFTDEQLFPGGFWKSFGVNSAGLSVDADEYNLDEGAGRIVQFLFMLRRDKDRGAITLNGSDELDPEDIMPVEQKHLDNMARAEESKKEKTGRLASEAHDLTRGRHGKKRDGPNDPEQEEEAIRLREEKNKRRQDMADASDRQRTAEMATANKINSTLDMEMLEMTEDRKEKKGGNKVSTLTIILGYLQTGSSFKDEHSFRQAQTNMSDWGCDDARVLGQLDEEMWGELLANVKRLKKETILGMLADIEIQL